MSVCEEGRRDGTGSSVFIETAKLSLNERKMRARVRHVKRHEATANRPTCNILYT